MQILVLGAGQLARMMALSGAPLNLQVMAFDVNTNQVVHPVSNQVFQEFNSADSAADSLSALKAAIAQCDVITAEFEHIPLDILDVCEQSGKLKPSAQAILTGGDRRVEKKLLDDAKVSNAPYALINTKQDFEQAIESLGLPLVLKTALGGYDGKGQWRIKEMSQFDEIWTEMAAALAVEPTQGNPAQGIVAEKFIPFQREVSIIGARNPQGEVITYQLAQNTHLDGVLRFSLTIEDAALQAQATEMFQAITQTLDYVGVLAVEFFDLDGKLLVNEIAPRVHNSGHWTQQGSDVCQFENHLRAVAGLPLGHPNAKPSAMINLLGIDELPQELLAIPYCHIHWYGKEKRAGRKMGHINVVGRTPEILRARLVEVAKHLDEKDFPQLQEMIQA